MENTGATEKQAIASLSMNEGDLIKCITDLATLSPS